VASVWQTTVITVVTSFSPEGYDLYGKRFIETFKEFWPKEVKLICAWEGPSPDPKLDGFDLLSTEPARSFFEKHAEDLVIHGKLDAPPAKWAAKARREGYSVWHDAYKFAHKVFSICAATKYVEGGKLFWIDADVETHSQVPVGLLDSLLPDGTSLCYLARPGYHSELGFTGYNLDVPLTRQFLDDYLAQYEQGLFVLDPAWDDCHQFDYLVKSLVPKMIHIPHTSHSQPFDSSVLGKYMTHYKGRRKAA
jgi:hypothetical protein